MTKGVAASARSPGCNASGKEKGGCFPFHTNEPAFALHPGAPSVPRTAGDTVATAARLIQDATWPHHDQTGIGCSSGGPGAR